ncbi:Thiol-disulfide isomerase or thioredoxin [Pricia antarctica]|uniref:Thiol-disulfide isomerase or thioredoxin n=1 Tax=Pricia antarctica TaxID=641691 RepID=A0A1G7IR41_9FLAO|nr:TlpA disulfide reductase family protein [Pricia antarctica]SDF15230.1 Thiol-disulfide isomerase or thioredoxin [Pricia antarctica]
MKAKGIILLGMLTVVFFGCKKEDNRFSLNGKIAGNYKGYIFLKYNDVLDSSLVMDNSFTFKGKVAFPTVGVLYPGRPSSTDMMTLGTLMLENSPIDIYAKYSFKNSNMGMTKFLDIDSIYGSESQNLRDRFEDKMSETVHNEKVDSIKGGSLYNNLHEFISDNPRSVMSGEYLAGLGSYFNYLDDDQFERLLKLMDTSYQDKGDLNKIRSLIKQSKLFKDGNIPPDLILPNQEGNMVDRLSFKGNVVLLEFWASWCAPCRQTNPELLNVYDSFRTEGFEIFGVSIDRNKQEWQMAIKEDDLGWPQVIDSLRSTEKTYNLNSIPFNLLLDREGRIMAQNVKPGELSKILVRVL